MKNFIRKPPPPLFFLSEYFILNSTCRNLGSVKPTTDGRCCTHKSYLLDVVIRFNLFTRLPSLIVSTLPMKRILAGIFPGIMGHTHLMGNSLRIGLGRTTTSESGTHELVNSMASPSQCLTWRLPPHLS